ncbi:unnamed protein product [Mesocestoides corti]|uniref:SAM domain-containing protein n=1 Tax=Mesocestoides corti TaxID=53468 RepID=A0A0R3U5X8_MESCO|nr:unnamed protein product [Mesocestoides corti]
MQVALPHLCIVCDDYIVTPKCTARQCFTCGHLFHASCVVKADRCAGSLSPSSGDGDSDILAACEASASVALSEQLLTNWTLEQVLQWLVVVGLSRYTTLFLSYNINGETLPSLLKPPSPLDDIKDSFARCSLKGAVMTLIGELPCPGDRLVTPKDPDTKSAASLPHTDLRIRNFTSELACCVCGLPLLGELRSHTARIALIFACLSSLFFSKSHICSGNRLLRWLFLLPSNSFSNNDPSIADYPN